MSLLYGKYSFLATGGCIGDVLFFFCSGFTLFLKPLNGIAYFPNWYKRRIRRIYPSVFAAAILGCLFFYDYRNIVDIIISSKYWFIPCIMIYYVAIFFIGIYAKNRIKLILFLVILISGAWFYFMCSEPQFTLYANKYGNGTNYVRWLLFFVFMLMGAKMGMQDKKNMVCSPLMDFIMLLISLVAFYAIFILTMKMKSLVVFQFFSVFPLISAIYFFYKLGLSCWAEKLYNTKIGYFIIRFVGGLCLEIYMIQYYLFTDKMNSLFPLNIFIMFTVIIIAAYFTRCLARIIAQTFTENGYEWKQITNIY